MLILAAPFSFAHDLTWLGVDDPNAAFERLTVRAKTQRIQSTEDLVDVFYPINDREPNRRYPLIVFLQGALTDKAFYSQYAQSIASFGFVVAVPNHRSPLLGGNDLFAESTVITDVIEHMEIQVRKVQSPLYNRVDATQVGISGHSFGGLAALFAINNTCFFPVCNPASGFQRPAEIKAAALVGAQAGGADIDSTGIPTAFLVGEFDSGLERFINTYDTLESPKALIEVAGADHFGLNDINEPPGSNTDREDRAQKIPQAITVTQFGEWAGTFYRAHIYNDAQAWRMIYESGGNDLVSINAEP